MNLTEEIKKSVESRNYEEVAKYMQQVCEDVLGYRRIAECQPIDALEVLSSYSGIMRLPSEEEFQNGKLGELEITKIVKTPKTVRDVCWHYANSSEINPEGIIVNLWYKEVGNKFILGCEEIGAPPVITFGYGDRWFGKGEIKTVSDCKRQFLKIPQYIFAFDRIDLKRFLGVIENI